MKWNYLSITALMSVLIVSCSSVMYLQGDYAESYSEKTTLSYNEVWDNVIDYFADTGISITTMEKASGLIVANKVQVPLTEELKGKPIDSKAYVVIPKLSMGYTAPKRALVSFNVRVRDKGDYVLITVKMHDIRGVTTIGMFQTTEYKGKTTGVFESNLIKLLLP